MREVLGDLPIDLPVLAFVCVLLVSLSLWYALFWLRLLHALHALRALLLSGVGGNGCCVVHLMTLGRACVGFLWYCCKGLEAHGVDANAVRHSLLGLSCT